MICELYRIIQTSNKDEKIVVNIDWRSDGGKRFINSNLVPNNIWLDFGSHVFDYLNFLGSTKSWGPLNALAQNNICTDHLEFPELCTSVRLVGKNVLINISLCRISNQAPRHYIELSFENGNIYFTEQKYPFNLRDYNSSTNFEQKISTAHKSFDIRIFDEIQQFKEIWKELTSEKLSDNLADQVSAAQVHDIIRQVLLLSRKSVGTIEQ
jgi:predicted dehydrogenase